MYAPHTVSLISRQGDGYYLTILRGVMLQAQDRMSLLSEGDADAANTRLFIPEDAEARNAEGEESGYLPPLLYERSEEPERHWTLRSDGQEAGRNSFFIKGEIPEAVTLAEARERYDGVYLVVSVARRDYGKTRMRHFEVSSRLDERLNAQRG